MEAAGTVLEVLSVSFGTLQKAVAGQGSEQQMPVEAAGRVLEVSFETYKKIRLGEESQERAANASGGFWRCYPGLSKPHQSSGYRPREPGASSKCQWKLQGGFWRCYPSASKPYKKLRLGQESVEAAERVLEVLSGSFVLEVVSFGTLQKAVAREQAKRARNEQQMPVGAAGRVLEVLSVSFETLQKAPARPRASGSCREGFGGAIRQFRNPTKSCGWKAKGARSEQLMQVCSESRWKLQGRFWRCYPSVSEPYKKLWLEGQGSQERTANAGESRWKLQGRFWRCYPSVSEPYKKLRLGQEPVEAAERVLEVLSGSFETLQKAVAGRPREPGASS